MITARWILAGLLGALFVYLAVGNLYVAVIKPLLRREHESWIPIVGGLSGVLACLAAPDPAIRAWWWLPLLLDFGTVPGLTWTVVFHVRRLLKE